MIRFIVPVFLLLAWLNISAQEYRILGSVVDSDTGEPLVGATIRVDDTGTTTDAFGDFHWEQSHPFDSITISFVGYQTYILRDVIRDTLFVKLEPAQSMLDAAVISASRYEQRAEKSVVSLEVLGADEIDDRHTYTLEGALDQMPGVSIIGGQPNIRGGSGFAYGAGSRVMLLIDGIPALQADVGYPNWDDIPVENIKQVEVVKGAGSALYGSAALNGVIHVRTQYATNEPQTEAFMFYKQFLRPRDPSKKWWDGIRGGWGASIAHRRKLESLDISGSMYHIDEETPNQYTHNNYLRSNLSLRYRVSDHLNFSLSSNLNTGNTGSFLYWKGDGKEAYLADTSTLVESERTRFYIDPKVVYRSDHGGVHRLQGRWHKVDNNVSNSRSNASDLLYAEYLYQKRFKELDLSLNAGLTWQYSKGEAPLYGDTTFKMFSHALYVQADKEWIDNRLTTSLGFRYERNIIRSPGQLQSIDLGSQRFEEAKPVLRSGINFELFPGSFLRSSFGQGYRFPTLAEKFITTDLGPVFITPYPAFQSEDGWSAELGVRQGIRFGMIEGYIDAAYFWQEYDDMIEFVFTGDKQGFQAQNIGDTRIKGIELVTRLHSEWGSHEINGQFGYTYIHPVYQQFTDDIRIRSSSDENILKYRSKHRMKAQFSHSCNSLDWGGSMRYASHQEAIDAIFRLFIPGLQEFRSAHDDGYIVCDAWIGYRFGNWGLSLNVKNVFNEEYSIRPGLLEAPRNFSVRLIYTDL